MVSFGNATGAVPAFEIGMLAAKGSLKVTRPTLMTYVHDRPMLESMAKDLIARVESGQVKIEVNQRYPLADAAQAHIDLESRQTTGSTVLLP
jgi:NADPH2:quinone reductase